MTKQEEIISGMLNLKQIYCHNCKYTKVECDKTVGDSLICRGNIDVILTYLKSQGVVIKKEIAVDDYNHNTTAYDELI